MVFPTLSKKVVYFAIFAHAPQVATRVSSKYESRERAKQHDRMFTKAPPEAFFGRRRMIGGMVGALGRALFARGRVKFTLRWPLFLRPEFITLWQELSECRITVLGWISEPSPGGEKNWEKAKGAVAVMRASWALEPKVAAGASPVDGPG